MTVAEVIAWLQTQPQDAIVVGELVVEKEEKTVDK